MGTGRVPVTLVTHVETRNRQDRSEKNKLDRSKTNRGGIFKTFMEPGNRFQGIDSASLCPGRPTTTLFQHRAGIFKQSMGTRNRVGLGLL